MNTTANTAGPSTTNICVSIFFDDIRVVQQLSVCHRTTLLLGKSCTDQLQEFNDEHEINKAIDS